MIVSWNTEALLRVCLDSIAEHLTAVPHEVIVVDNASEDGSAEMVEGSFPSVKLIRNTTNVGFGRANNQAMHMARGRWLLLLNSDTVLLDDSVARLFETLDRDRTEVATQQTSGWRIAGSCSPTDASSTPPIASRVYPRAVREPRHLQADVETRSRSAAGGLLGSRIGARRRLGGRLDSCCCRARSSRTPAASTSASSCTARTSNGATGSVTTGWRVRYFPRRVDHPL